jgi:DNA-binding winged helix-turn-helix (wHTH) protein
VSTVLTFADFEFSRSTQRLTRGGKPQHLTGQPLQLLAVLLEEPGRLVTRDEIRARLWPDTTVDFEHSLDVALNRLRAVLGDSARQAAFIETVPRVGYRFIAEVRVAIDESPFARRRSIAARVGWYALTAIVAALVALAIVHQHYDKFVDRSSHSLSKR